MHSEAIISENEENVSKFFVSVDAAALYHNASTRFTDGSEFDSELRLASVHKSYT